MKVNDTDNTFTTATLTVPGRSLGALAVLIALASVPSSTQPPPNKPNQGHGLFGSLAPVSQLDNEGDQNDDD